MKPEAPVTSALAVDMVPHGFAVLFDLSHCDLRGPVRARGKIAIPARGEFDRLGKRQWRPPAQQRTGLAAVKMEKPRFGETAWRDFNLRSHPDGRELFDQIAHRAGGLIA